MSDFRKSIALRWTSKLRTFLNKTNDTRYHSIFTELKCAKLFDSILGRNTMQGILLQYIYGHLRGKLKELDNIRYEEPSGFYSFDASESDIPNKLGKQIERRKNRINCSTMRVVDKYCIWLSGIKWLAKGGESYVRTFQEQLGGVIIAENMLRSKTNGNILNPVIATDVATESNADNVRLAIVTGVMNTHQLAIDEPVWKSPMTKNVFDLRDFRLNVCSFKYIPCI